MTSSSGLPGRAALSRIVFLPSALRTCSSYAETSITFCCGSTFLATTLIGSDWRTEAEAETADNLCAGAGTGAANSLLAWSARPSGLWSISIGAFLCGEIGAAETAVGTGESAGGRIGVTVFQVETLGSAWKASVHLWSDLPLLRAEDHLGLGGWGLLRLHCGARALLYVSQVLFPSLGYLVKSGGHDLCTLLGLLGFPETL